MLSCCYQLSLIGFAFICIVLCVVVTLSDFSLSLSLSLSLPFFPSFHTCTCHYYSLSFLSPSLFPLTISPSPLPPFPSLSPLSLSPLSLPSLLSLSPKGHTQVNWWGDGPQTKQVTQQQQADASRDTTTQPSLSPKHTGVRCKKKYHIHMYTVHPHAHVLWHVILRV